MRKSKINTSKVYLRTKDLNEGKALIQELKKMPDYYRGDTTVYLFTEDDRKSYRMSKDIWINLESDAVSYFKEIIGEENVKIIE